MGNRRKGLSVAQAAQLTGLSESTVRRWVDNYLAAQAGDPLPHPGQGQLKGWKSATKRGSGGADQRAGGRERRVDPAAAEAVRQERRVDPTDAERVRRENAGEPSAPAGGNGQ